MLEGIHLVCCIVMKQIGCLHATVQNSSAEMFMLCDEY